MGEVGGCGCLHLPHCLSTMTSPPTRLLAPEGKSESWWWDLSTSRKAGPTSRVTGEDGQQSAQARVAGGLEWPLTVHAPRPHVLADAPATPRFLWSVDASCSPIRMALPFQVTVLFPDERWVQNQPGQPSPGCGCLGEKIPALGGVFIS